MGLSNPSLNNGEHPANNNPPQKIKGIIWKDAVVNSNKIGNKRKDVITQYPVNINLLFPPNK